MRKLVLLLIVLICGVGSAQPFAAKPSIGSQVDWSNPINNGLIAWWPMNEGSGNRILNLASNRSAGPFVGNTKFAVGAYGACVLFDGSSSYIDTELKPTSAGTLACWFNRTQAVSAVLMGCLEAGANRAYLGVQTYVCGGIGTQSWSIITGTTAASVNTWVFAAITWDGTMVRVYRNGVMEYNAAQSGVCTTLWPYWIGGNNGAGSLNNPFPGQMANVSFWNRALTPAEVEQLYRNQWGGLLGKGFGAGSDTVNSIFNLRGIFGSDIFGGTAK